jgi:hypothetical protein
MEPQLDNSISSNGNVNIVLVQSPPKPKVGFLETESPNTSPKVKLSGDASKMSTPLSRKYKES